MHHFTEESGTVTLRARLLVLTVCSVLLLFGAYSGIDTLNSMSGIYANKPAILKDLYLPIAISGGVICAFLWIRQSNWTDKLIIASLGIIGARAIAGAGLTGYEYAAVLYIATFYYVFVLFNNLIHAYFPRFVALFAAFVLLIPAVLCADAFRFTEYYATYAALLFVVAMWIRYFWLLEYKRRKRCDTCSGWGRITAKYKDIFWWGVGYKEKVQSADAASQMKQDFMRMLGYKDYQSTPSTCNNCKGRGWHYRHKNLLHD